MAQLQIDELVESRIEKAVSDAMGDAATKIIQGVNKLAEKQGGETTL